MDIISVLVGVSSLRTYISVNHDYKLLVITNFSTLMHFKKCPIEYVYFYGYEQRMSRNEW